MADEKVEFKLDLDNESFVKGANEALKSIEELGDTESLKGLLTNFKQLGIAAGLVGGAVLVAKAAFDMTSEADSVAATTAQFDILTRQVGVSGEAMKEALTKAAGGLLDDSDAMELANKQIIRFGESADKLPQIMELARKASALTGESLASTFEGMSQAIGNGNARALKHFGIFVDGEKVIREYAKSNGLAVDALSESAKRQAVLNAAISDGESRLSKVNPNLNETSVLVKQLSVAWKELGESVSVVVGKIVGPFVKDALKYFTDLAGQTKQIFSSIGDTINANLGDGVERAKAQVNTLSTELNQQKLRMLQAQEGDVSIVDRLFFGSAKNVEADAKKKIDSIRADLLAAQSLLANQKTEESSGGDAPQVKETQENAQKRLEIENKFAADLLKLRQQTNDAELQNAQSIEQVDAAIAEKRLIMKEQLAAQEAQIDQNGNLNDTQKAEMKLQLENDLTQKLLTLDQTLDAQRMASLNNYEQQSTSTADGVARAFEAMGKRSSVAFNNFATTGQAAAKSFERNSTSALLAFGEGSKSASEAAKGFFFGFLADTAEAQGKVMLPLAFVGNFAAAAAGAGLIVLAGLLRSQSGGKSSGGIGGGSVGGGESGGGFSASGISNQVSLNEQQKKTVSLTVQGSYFETEQTKTRLVEMIRSASDATDFNIKSVGE